MNLFPPRQVRDLCRRRDRLCAQLTRAASPLFLCLCARRRSPARAWICITPALSSQIPCCIILRPRYAIIRYEGIVRNRLWQLEPIGEDLIDALVSFCPQDIFTIVPHNSADVSFPIRRCSSVLRRSRIRPVQMKRGGENPRRHGSPHIPPCRGKHSDAAHRRESPPRKSARGERSDAANRREAGGKLRERRVQEGTPASNFFLAVPKGRPASYSHGQRDHLHLPPP